MDQSSRNRRYTVVRGGDMDEDHDIIMLKYGNTRRGAWSTAVMAIALLISVTTNFLLLGKTCQYPLSASKTWYNIDSIPPREKLQFDASFTPHSKYTGFGPLVDAEWDRFTMSPLIDGTAVVLAVTKEEVLRSGKQDNGTVPFEIMVPIGDRHMGTIEMFHQLHCLNVLRKFVHRDYYQAKDPYFSSHDIGNHTDHCAEVLRQVLMCNGDAQLITFHWVDGWPGAVPDFNTWHSCRNPNQLLDWAQQKAAPITKPLSKPANAKALPERP